MSSVNGCSGPPHRDFSGFGQRGGSRWMRQATVSSPVLSMEVCQPFGASN